MGDSGWLQNYKREIMAEAVITMVRDAGFKSKPAIIGHSMGGMVSLMTSHIYHQELAALMMCDYYVRPLHARRMVYGEDENGVMRPRETRPTRIYEDFDTALARFRLQPEQPCANQFIVDFIGEHLIARGRRWLDVEMTHICIATSPWAATGRDLSRSAAADSGHVW